MGKVMISVRLEKEDIKRIEEFQNAMGFSSRTDAIEYIIKKFFAHLPQTIRIIMHEHQLEIEKLDRMLKYLESREEESTELYEKYVARIMDRGINPIVYISVRPEIQDEIETLTGKPWETWIKNQIDRYLAEKPEWKVLYGGSYEY